MQEIVRTRGWAYVFDGAGCALLLQLIDELLLVLELVPQIEGRHGAAKYAGCTLFCQALVEVEVGNVFRAAFLEQLGVVGGCLLRGWSLGFLVQVAGEILDFLDFAIVAEVRSGGKHAFFRVVIGGRGNRLHGLVFQNHRIAGLGPVFRFARRFFRIRIKD